MTIVSGAGGRYPCLACGFDDIADRADEQTKKTRDRSRSGRPDPAGRSGPSREFSRSGRPGWSTRQPGNLAQIWEGIRHVIRQRHGTDIECREHASRVVAPDAGVGASYPRLEPVIGGRAEPRLEPAPKSSHCAVSIVPSSVGTRRTRRRAAALSQEGTDIAQFTATGPNGSAAAGGSPGRGVLPEFATPDWLAKSHHLMKADMRKLAAHLPGHMRT